MLENGSGDGVIRARKAVFPLCAAKTIKPPNTQEANCMPRERYVAA
jgi:hypothetical protein